MENSDLNPSIVSFDEGDIGVCGIGPFFIGISVIFILNCGKLLRYSPNLRDAFSWRFGRQKLVYKRIPHFFPTIFESNAPAL